MISINPQSLLCRSILPMRSLSSSRDCGWTSLLLDLHSGVTSHEAYESVVTDDPRIGVTVSGRYLAEFWNANRWRHDTHGPGSINVHRTGEQTRYRFPKPQDPDFQLALIYYPKGELERAWEHLRRPAQASSPPSFDSLVGRDPAITQMTLAVLQAMQRGYGDFYAESVAAWLAVHMLTFHSDHTQTDDRRDEISDQRLARTIEFMSSNFSQPLTLDQLAAEACISKYHFNRLFTRKVGSSPHRYLAGLRLDAAHQMLTSTDLPVSHIAVECGYPSSKHFSVAFSRRFGMTPTECRTAVVRHTI
jgi:AraC family transcriptional regulator